MAELYRVSPVPGSMDSDVEGNYTPPVEMGPLLNHSGESVTDDEDEGDFGIPLTDVHFKKRSFWRILMDGPLKPVQPTVTCWLEPIQRLPDVALQKVPLLYQRLCLAFFIVIWAAVFKEIATHSILSTPHVDGKPVDLLRCHMVPFIWSGKNAECGLNGEACFGSYEGEEYAFKCPADCTKESWTYSETPVGLYESIYRSYVIGGNNSYRADSFLCAAAIHHGVVSDRTGGCAKIKFNGWKPSFLSESSNGIDSIPFDTEFPASYMFESLQGLDIGGCRDLREVIITINIVLSLVFGFIVKDVKAFFWVNFMVGFWTIILASNPPRSGGDPNSNAELISLAFQRLLPGLLGSYVIYKSAVYPQLHALDANLSRVIFWLGGFWIGILENIVFAYLPLDRLTVHDLNTQAGAWLALIVLISVIVTIVFSQAYIIWRLGKFKPYISLYLGFAALLFLLAMIPHETLRIHHYILALIFLPGTGFKTTPSLFYQGLLVGLYIAGISRWGFDSILQTYNQLRRGAPALVAGIPEFLSPHVAEIAGTAIKNVTLTWRSMQESKALNGTVVERSWDGYSLIVNDVERYRGVDTSFDLTTWVLELGQSMNRTLAEMPIKYYVRLAFGQASSELDTGDFTKTGVVDLLTGNWTGPLPGAI